MTGRAAAAPLPCAEPPPEMDAAGETPAGTLPGDESPEVGGLVPGGLGRVFGAGEHVWGAMAAGRGSGRPCPGDRGVQSWMLRL